MYQRDSEILLFFSAQRDQEVSTKPSQLVAHTAGHCRCCGSVPQLFSITVSTAVSKYLKQTNKQQQQKTTNVTLTGSLPWKSLTNGWGCSCSKLSTKQPDQGKTNKQKPPKLSFAKRMKSGRGPFGLTVYIYLHKNSWVSLCWVRKTLTTTSQWKLTELYSKSLSWAWSRSVILWYRLWPQGEPTSTHQSREVFVLSSSSLFSVLADTLSSLLLLHFFQHHKLHQDLLCKHISW